MYTKMIMLLNSVRASETALSYGEYKELVLTNRQYMFSRTAGDRVAIVAVNNDDNEATINAGGIPDGEYTGAISKNTYTVSGGGLSITIPANYGEILIKNEKCGE